MNRSPSDAPEMVYLVICEEGRRPDYSERVVCAYPYSEQALVHATLLNQSWIRESERPTGPDGKAHIPLDPDSPHCRVGSKWDVRKYVVRQVPIFKAFDQFQDYHSI